MITTLALNIIIFPCDKIIIKYGPISQLNRPTDCDEMTELNFVLCCGDGGGGGGKLSDCRQSVPIYLIHSNNS